jgi:tripartite motif-containing protein 71
VFNENGTYEFSVPNPPAPPPTGGFNGPRGVAFDPAGHMYVTDMYNERVEEFSPSAHGGYTFTQAWGERGDTPNTFNYPRLTCWDPLTVTKSGHGALIVANTDSNQIVAWNTATNPPGVTWSTTGNLSTPYGVSCDAASGDIYVANSNGHDIVVYDNAGKLLGTIGASTLVGFTRGVWVDTDGSVWADVSTSAKVYHFKSWAAGGASLGSFTIAAGGTPFGIAGDSKYLYIALSSANEVVQYNRTGTLAGTFGGAGTTTGRMRTPQGLSFGPDGKLYVVEENNNRVSQWSVP